MKKTLFLMFFIPSLLFAQKKDELIEVSTKYGKMLFVLYDQTPKHKANFLKLTKEKFYDGLLFHRVIKDFMIQGGDPDSKNAKPGVMLGMGGLNYRVDAEFKPELFHKKGVLAAARDNNPQKASSSCQFYIVQGKTVNDAELEAYSQRTKATYTEEQKNTYKTLGGTPFLDQNYTVYGEMLSGMEILDKIAQEATDTNNRPKEDVKMEVRVIKMKRKAVEKKYTYKYPTKK
ncbi:MAG: peptidylprolyl isomerase [Thermonemataceae bacterium]|nr:peptidylprolyl isomerase [Thermonemataceae bacterium]